jgi:hypothetical protein
MRTNSDVVVSGKVVIPSGSKLVGTFRKLPPREKMNRVPCWRS